MIENMIIKIEAFIIMLVLAVVFFILPIVLIDLNLYDGMMINEIKGLLF